MLSFFSISIIFFFLKKVELLSRRGDAYKTKHSVEVCVIVAIDDKNKSSKSERITIFIGAY